MPLGLPSKVWIFVAGSIAFGPSAARMTQGDAPFPRFAPRPKVRWTHDVRRVHIH